MVIKVDGPQIQILLYKMTGVNFTTGAVYRGAASGLDTIDLAPLLGDAGSVRTMKALDEPCGGFSITFADRINNQGGDTVYALEEPYVWSQKINVNGDIMTPAFVPQVNDKAHILFIEVPKNSVIRYEINPPSRAVQAGRPEHSMPAPPAVRCG